MARVICTKKNQGHPTNNIEIPILHLNPGVSPTETMIDPSYEMPPFTRRWHPNISQTGNFFYHGMFMAYHGAMQGFIYFGANFHFMELKNR